MRPLLRATLISLLSWLPGHAPAEDALPPLEVDPALLMSAGMQPVVRDPLTNYPNFIAADRIAGQQDVETVAEGAVELRGLGRSVEADFLTYWPREDEVEATGSVVLRRDGDVVAGPKLRLKLESNVGFIDRARYSILRTPADAEAARQPVRGWGEAERIDFEGEGLYKLAKASYSTCSPQNRDWHVQVDEFNLDYNRERGEAKNALLLFQGAPLFYSPWLSFSLNNARKTGLLVPTLGSTSQGGMELTQPWYWNIAPNMDATIAPRFIQKRGTQLNGEYRYLGQSYAGQINGQYMDRDHVFNGSRHAYSVLHDQNLGGGFSASLNMSGVSDDTYFSDLSTRLSLVSQTNLLRQGRLGYSGGWWGASVMAQRYQTLQDPSAPPVAIPYARLPQATLTANRQDLPLGGAFIARAEYVDFAHPTQVVGQRWLAYPQIALPYQTAAFFVTPKVGVHATRYSLERQAAGTPRYLDRTVPIASIDSGLAFERGFDWMGRGMIQTLEPRLYYVNIPHRDQSSIPVFDTATTDFNFAQIFSENRYSGSDRIGDANQLTAMLSSRLIDPASGEELLRGAIGQRYYFTDQRVTLPGETPRNGRNADLLATLSGQIARKTWLDSGWQYNPRDQHTERFNVAARFQPEPGRVINAGYRYTRGQIGQFDVSAQWPVWGGWHGVGRYNYSMRDGRVIESVGGVEYDGGCWVARAVAQRVATLANNSNTAFYIQLELNGFSRIGSNPLEILKRSVPGYGRISPSAADPVFAE